MRYRRNIEHRAVITLPVIPTQIQYEPVCEAMLVELLICFSRFKLQLTAHLFIPASLNMSIISQKSCYLKRYYGQLVPFYFLMLLCCIRLKVGDRWVRWIFHGTSCGYG